MSLSKYCKSVFNQDWTDPSVNPDVSAWISGVPKNPYAAYCTLCKKTFSLSNMGKRAVFSHAESAKHKKFLSDKKLPSVLDFISVANSKKEEPTKADDASITARAKTSCTKGKTCVSNFVVQDQCFKAEITWALKLVSSHSSFNAFNDASEIFSHMFTDSEIAKKCTLGRAKISYLVCYGLAPYFHQSLEKSLRNNKYVVCFDEALNRISQRCQMDIVVRYWNESENRVSTRFWNSVFLGRTTAEELFENFKEAMTDLNIKLMLQISMDGPNVNLKFLKYIKELLSENECDILDLGTCGLHIVHGAFQFGHKSTNWKLDALLRSLYNLFKDSPARRANFTEITGSTEFPLKFCAIRWVENVCVCERALKVFDNVKKYVEMSKKCLPETATSDSVINACRDKLILARISFFSYVANILEPFLRKFQTSNPMVPFLYGNFHTLFRKLMKIIIKDVVISEAKSLETLIAIDFEDAKNVRLRKNIDIGIVTSRWLEVSGVSESQKAEFLNDCVKFIKAIVKKLLQRTSKNYAVLRAASSLNPVLLKTNAVLCEKRMNNLLQLLYSKDKISSASAERAKLQFQDFLSKIKSDYKENFAAFTEDVRLDDFFCSLLRAKEFSDLWEVVKVVLILSHGNADVESGFSINKDMLVENLKEDSLVGLRTVYDAVKAHGGLLNVPLTKDLLCYAKFARQRYHDALEKKKQIQKRDAKAENNKHKISQQIRLLQKKKMKVIDEKSTEVAEIDQQISELIKMNN